VLAQADAVLYDRLIAPEVLEYVRADALKECVGKAPGGGGWSQSRIERRLIGLAQRYRRVVRLKGGDPFVFGRGGEELLALTQAGIETEVIPGVSSAWSAPALANIPVTMRGVSAGVVVVSGHEPAHLEWDILANSGYTVVFLMAMAKVAEISRHLIAHGMRSTTPVAVVERAASPHARTVTCSLIQLPDTVVQHDLTSPAVIVVGNVVKVRETVEIAIKARSRDSAR
jgi:uroporphyrin-III C-methyltransferase